MDPTLFSAGGIPLTSSEGGPPYAAQAYTENPYPWYAWHRAHRPVLTARFKDGYGEVRKRHYFFRHADIRTLLCDPRLGREAKFERMPADAPSEHQLLLDMAKTFFIFKDPPSHTRMRRAVQFLFDTSRLKLLEHEFQKQAHRILDGVGASGSFDVIADFAAPLMLETAQELLGVRCESRSQLYRQGRAVVTALGGGFDDARMRAGAEASCWFQDMVGRSLAAEALGEGLGWASELAEKVRDGSGLQADELVGTLIFLLLAATDNTVSAVGNAMTLLCRYPECWSRLREHPELLPNATAELIRLESPLQSVERYPLQPFDFSGIELCREDGIVLMLGSANRDAEAFPEPDLLDFGRSRGSHATFGFGIHGCPGAFLARLLTTVALQVLTSRFESIVSAEDTLPWRPMVISRGLERLRVRGTTCAGRG